MLNEQPERDRGEASTDWVRTVTGETFASLVLEGAGPKVVEFMSYGCSYCRQMEPILQRVAEMVQSRGEIFRVNIAVEQDLADSYQVEATPTFLLFLGGEEIGRVEGAIATAPALLTALTEPFRGRR